MDSKGVNNDKNISFDRYIDIDFTDISDISEIYQYIFYINIYKTKII